MCTEKSNSVDVYGLSFVKGIGIPIIRWALNFIKNELPDHIGKTVCGADLCHILTDTVNRNGIYEDDSWGFIKNNIDDARDAYMYFKDQGSFEVANPFENPEMFVVQWLTETVCSILEDIPIIHDNWNREFELNTDIIDNICTFYD